MKIFQARLMFCFCPVSFLSSTYTDKNSLFSWLTNKHPQLGNFSQPYFLKELSRIAFPTIVLPKDDRTDFVHDQLGLPYWTMILAICASVDLHKSLNHLSQYRLGVRLDLCTFGALPPIRHSSNDRCPSVKQNELLRPSSVLHRSPQICF